MTVLQSIAGDTVSSVFVCGLPVSVSCRWFNCYDSVHLGLTLIKSHLPSFPLSLPPCCSGSAALLLSSGAASCVHWFITDFTALHTTYLNVYHGVVCLRVEIMTSSKCMDVTTTMKCDFSAGVNDSVVYNDCVQVCQMSHGDINISWIGRRRLSWSSSGFVPGWKQK